MSENIRQQDEGIRDWLRRLSSRIDRLERGDKGVRVNDTRLGDLVLKPNALTNQIEATNLQSGVMTPITSFRETVFSWPGRVALAGVAENNESPYEVIPDETVANELILVRSLSGTTPNQGALTVQFIFARQPGSSPLSITMGIPANQHIRARSINVPVRRNDLIGVKLTCMEDATTNNLTAIVRYGQPTGEADNTTVDAFCPPEA
jgi:hypothetical protein